MKNIKTLGIIATVAIITFAMTACGGGGGPSGDPDTGDPNTGGDGGGAKTFTSIDDVSDYLAEADGGDSADKPIKLKVEIALGDGSEANSGWQKLLAALDAAGKFVDLDLSGCTVTEFNTGVKYDSDKNAWVRPDGIDKIVSLTLPNGVTTIGMSAFIGCTSLTSVTIPAGVTTIGEATFYGCTGLTSVSIPNSVTTIGDGAFIGCTSLTSVTIGSGVTSIGDNAFNGCRGLTSVTIPAGVTTIGQRRSIFAPA